MKDTKPLALISVYDKEGIVGLARELVGTGWEIISSGGTAKVLRDDGLPVKDVSEYTGAPEMMDGRVKTLHPAIHAGILADRGDISHMDDLEGAGFRKIDLVVCNLYPFEKVAAGIPKPHDRNIAKEIIENIDIGGPTMLRAAAKNYKHVLVATDPNDYELILEGLETEGFSMRTRLELAARAIAHTAYYDSLIADYLNYEKFPLVKTIPMVKTNADLRYGENPHQKAALYFNALEKSPSAAMMAQKLHGKDLSYNNFLDLDAAQKFIHEYSTDKSICTIIKHNNTCGAAIATTQLEAYRKSFAADPLSAFGGIMAFNNPVDADTAYEIVTKNKHFIECIIAPGFSDAAFEILSSQQNLRLLRQTHLYEVPAGLAYKMIDGGVLAQDKNTGLYDTKELMTKSAVSDEEMRSMDFAMRACKMTKSNGIILARGTQIVGVGTGQQSRIDSLDIAARRMAKMAPGSFDEKAPLVMASDAFFPFSDCVEYFANIGGRAIIWPGGSKNDQASIDAANNAKNKIAMLKTGMRHFSH